MPNSRHIMLDIETLGTGSSSIILSIGAVKFTSREILNTLHLVIDPESSEQYGLKMDASTVMWWMGFERDAARKSLMEHMGQSKLDLGSALEGFNLWYHADEEGNYSQQDIPVWGNGAAFDNVILRTSYEKAGIQPPWQFWNDRCYRTLKNLFPEIRPDEREGLHHNALHDALYQTKHLQKIMQYRIGEG